MKIELGLVMALICSLTSGCALEGTDDGEDLEGEEFESTADPIINGRADFGHAAVGAIKWTVTRPDGTTGTSICTGTLVTERTVLTAAHCVVPPDASRFSNFRVFFGRDASARGATYLPVASVAAHPKYSPKVFGSYDVAVLVLANDAPVKPAKVARSIGNLTGKKVTHVGFGTTLSKDAKTKSGAGTQKFAVSLPVTQQTDLLLRTGNGESGICNGDSGGPALVRVRGVDVVVGVHSYINDSATCLKDGFSARPDVMRDFLDKYLCASRSGSSRTRCPRR